MKKSIRNFIIALTIITPSISMAQLPVSNNDTIHIDMSCQKIDKSENNLGGHRIPVHVPNVYIIKETSSLYFEDPCYECTLEIAVPGTDNIMYAYVIPDGDNVVTLPEWLEGQYELHIHRGNFCFWGIIEL